MISNLKDMYDRIPASIKADLFHPSLSAPGVNASNFFIIPLNENGEICEDKVYTITKEEANGHRFYNVQKTGKKPGLLNLNKVFSSENIGQSEQYGFDNFLSNGSFKSKPLADYIKNNQKALNDLGDDFEHPQINLYKRFLQHQDNLNAFVLEVCRVVRDHLKAQQDNEKPLNDKKMAEDVSDTLVIFENHTKVGATGQKCHTSNAYHSLSNRLREINNTVSKKNTEFVDGFGNKGRIVGDNDTYPDVKIPSIGNISAFQRYKPVRAYMNYGKRGNRTFPITVRTQEEVSEALQALVKDDHRGRLFDVQRLEFGGVKKPSAVLNLIHLVVPLLPHERKNADFTNQKVSDTSGVIFGHSIRAKKQDESSGVEESVDDFVMNVRSIIQSLRGEFRSNPGSEFSMLTILQKDQYAPCLAAQYNIDFDTLASRLELLNDAVDKALKRKLNSYQQTKPISVGDITIILNRKWTKSVGLDGSGDIIEMYGRSIRCYNFKHAEILSMFLYGNERLAQEALNHCGQYHSRLLADVQKRVIRREPPRLSDARVEVLYLPALISFLFSMKGQSMSEVRQSMAFKLGQALGNLDHLHRIYYDVDDRRYPQKLVGYEYLDMFLQTANTHKVWSRFASRAAYFAQWADSKYPEKVESERLRRLYYDAKYHYCKYLRYSLHSLSNYEIINRKLTDEDKVSLSLGYFSVGFMGYIQQQEQQQEQESVKQAV